jgi:hypothetical protein
MAGILDGYESKDSNKGGINTTQNVNMRASATL